MRIRRPALEARINAALDGGSVLLTAGAGYGKTLALDAALRRRGSRCAWIHCDEAYGDAGRLLRRLVAAVDAAAPGAVQVLSERLEAAIERIDVRAGIADLLEELDRHLVEPLVIVIDDAERLEAVPEATQVLSDLLTARVDELRVAAATRQSLPLRLAKLRQAGQLTEFAARDLAFTPEECGELLIASGRATEDQDEERLFAATDGWPLGATLIALHGDSSAAHGWASRSELFSFLREEVLDALPDELREQALKAATPRELNAGCMRALGLPARLPEKLAARGLAMQPAGSDLEWFTFHPLVREFLRCCRDEEMDSFGRWQLHRSVAPALDEAGRREEAIEHWIEGHAWDEAGKAIAAVAPTLIHTAPETVRRWLDALPEETRQAPACLLLHGLLAWEDGRNAVAVELLRSAVARFAGAGDVSGEWLARYALIDPLELMGEWEEAALLAQGFDDEAALGAGIVPPAVAAYAAAACGALGRMSECAALSRRILDHPHVGPLRSVQAIWECDKLIAEGRLDQAVAGAGKAVEEAERSDPFNRLPTFAFFHAALVAQQGRDADALALLEHAETLAEQRHMHYVVETARAWRALLHARNGRLEAGEQELARAGPTAGNSWRDAATETARARLAALRGDAEEVGHAAERARSLARHAVLFERFQAAIDLPPALLEAGLIPAARDLVEEYLALLDALHEADGSYYRAMLLAVRASLSDAEGREGDVTTDLQAMWASTAGQAADVVRRGWRVLEPLLWKALETDTLEPEPVLRSIGEAFPGGEAILPFTAHPHAEVRRVAVTAAASSGHPELPLRLSKLARDPDQEVAAAAGAAERRLRDEPPPLTFKVLGDFAVSRGCWQVDDRAWDRRVAQRIVRYLLVSRGRAVPDDLLLEAFWPDVAERSARQRLNVAVSCARAALDVPGAESVIEATEHTLRLRLRERDSVDADQFENAAGMALAPDQNNSRGLLERAASMWGGDPLPHERYATWAAAWREHLTDLYARVLARLAEVLHAQEDALAATVAAKKLVELDPLNEQANALLMAAYARSGRRGHALRQYLACRRNLLDELGVEPAEETTQMQQRILAGERV